jgi:hypothetical protein
MRPVEVTMKIWERRLVDGTLPNLVEQLDRLNGNLEDLIEVQMLLYGIERKRDARERETETDGGGRFQKSATPFRQPDE